MSLLAAALMAGLATVSARAQAQPSSYVTQVWQTEQGLPQNSVNAVAQDSDGYLWLATNGGVARFDGVRFKVLGVGDIPALRTARIHCVHAGGGALWIGTQMDGLIRLKGGVATTYAAKDGLPGGPVLSIREDREGALWINTLHGVARFAADKLQAYPTHQGRPVREFLLQARDRAFWFLSGKDVTRFGPDGAVSVLQGGNSVEEALDGSVWIAYADQYRLVRHHQEAFTDVALPRVERPQWMGAYAEQGVLAMTKDTDGELLLMTAAGVARVVNGKMGAPEPLPSPVTGGDQLKVLSFLVDREGNRWVGTRSLGLLRFRRAPVTAYGKAEGMSDSPVLSVAQDRDGRMWFGGEESLYWFDGQSFHRVPGVSDVRTIAGTRDGVVWFGGSGGLYRWRSGALTRYRIDAPAVIDILQDRQGTMWVVGQTYDRPGGLYRFREGRFDLVPGFSGVANIVEDRDGGLWLGSPRGLLYTRGGNTLLYDQKHGLPRNLLDHVFQDSTGTIWVPTAGGGLCRFRGGRFQAITTREGLPTDELFGLLEDGNGYLWAGSNQGVYRFRLRELNDAADGRGSSISSMLYGVPDGMRSSECNGGPQGQWKSRDGRLWFPTMRGVVAIDPTAANPLSPPVVLEEAWANRVKLDRNGRTAAPAGSSTFDFTFTALSLSAPDKQRFKYRLDPYDKDWVDAGARRNAHYTNMAPGEYSFQVIAANSYGVWNEQGTSIRFTLRPQFYQTGWFYALVAAACLAMLWMAYRFRLWQLQRAFDARLEERVDERTRIARDLHDTLLQSFHGVLLRLQGACNLLPERAPEARTVLESAIDDAAAAVTEARDAVEGLRSASTLSGDLLHAIRELGQELVSRRQSSGERAPAFSVEVEGEPRDLDPAHSDEIFRVAGEALRNAFQHARASRIEAEFRFDVRQLRIRVRDDGIGADPAVLQRNGRAGHWGMKGMRERARRLGGRLEVWSEHGAGTEVELILPASIAYAESASRGSRPRKSKEAGHS